MSENHKFEENGTQQEEKIVCESAVEATVNEVDEEGLIEEKSENINSSFMKLLSAKVLDEIIIGIISVIILYIFDAVLKLFGYNVSEKISMLFIIFVLISIIYTSVLENGKYKKTAGKKLFNI